MDLKAFQLKVTLRRTKPPIWRRLEVRGDTTLGRLHDILQFAMGWTHSHMHQFVAKEKCYGMSDPELGLAQENEERIRLDQVLRKPKDKLIYEYDPERFDIHEVNLMFHGGWAPPEPRG